MDFRVEYFDKKTRAKIHVKTCKLTLRNVPYIELNRPPTKKYFFIKCLKQNIFLLNVNTNFHCNFKYVSSYIIHFMSNCQSK